MPRLIFLLLFAAMALAAAFSLGEPREAVEAKCTPGRANNGQTYHAGWYRTPGSTPGGVYSKIYNYDPYVAPRLPGSPYLSDSVVAWTMLNSTSAGRWAQVGWMEVSAGFRYTFIQFHNVNGTLITNNQWTGQPENTYSYYTTLYNNYAPGWITFQVNGQDIAYVQPGFTPNQAQIFGETKSLASQMPGGYGSSYHVQLTDSNIYYSGLWRAFDGSVGLTNPTYHMSSKVSGWRDDIWDKACYS